MSLSLKSLVSLQDAWMLGGLYQPPTENLTLESFFSPIAVINNNLLFYENFIHKISVFPLTMFENVLTLKKVLLIQLCWISWPICNHHLILMNDL